MEAAFIRDLFQATSPEQPAVPWVEIAGMPEGQVAATLGEAAIYLSLCRFEAFSLSILEAMACGCVPVGFTGFGARLYTTDRNGLWVEEDDCIGCVEQLHRAVQVVTEGGPIYREILEAAGLTAREHSREALAARVLAFWRAYLESGKFPDCH